jgi:hypothetical protein
MKNKSFNNLILKVILFATILTTGSILLAKPCEYPDPIGSNLSLTQNV